MRGRLPKHFHPLLKKEKKLNNTLCKILPEDLAHLYGLPKTHKPELYMRLIMSATATYNFILAVWLGQKLKPPSVNQVTITDCPEFAKEVQALNLNDDELLVSYDVVSLFTNVPLKKTIQILADRAFTDDWFNKTYDLKLQRNELVELLAIATTNQLFQFGGELYEQVDGVAMGSPIGPLMADVSGIL